MRIPSESCRRSRMLAGRNYHQVVILGAFSCYGRMGLQIVRKPCWESVSFLAFLKIVKVDRVGFSQGFHNRGEGGREQSYKKTWKIVNASASGLR